MVGLAIALGVARLREPADAARAVVIYGSFERVGQLWFAFGWEIQILETTLIAGVLAHPWDPRPLAARPPPVDRDRADALARVPHHARRRA